MEQANSPAAGFAAGHCQRSLLDLDLLGLEVQCSQKWLDQGCWLEASDGQQ